MFGDLKVVVKTNAQEIGVLNRELQRMRKVKEGAEKDSPQRRRYALMEAVCSAAVNMNSQMRYLTAEDKEWIKTARDRHQEKLQEIRDKMEEEGYSDISARAMQRHQLWVDALESYWAAKLEEQIDVWRMGK